MEQNKNTKTIKYLLPDYVQKVARILIKEGYKAYLVGGAVRDIVLNKNPNDFDLATDAVPETMLKIFPKAVSTGAKFGMITALVEDSQRETFEVQVTTFRSEENYRDGRWPTDVKFVDDIDKDLGRRDFTINSMSIDLGGKGKHDDDISHLTGENIEKEWELYDPFDGLRDIGIKVVRAVGTPIERFKEDGLRPIRACRFASQLGFDIETETLNAIEKALPVVKMISKERFRDEFKKILYKSPKPSVGLELLRKTGILEIFIPELLQTKDVEQKLFHASDVWTHSMRAVDTAPDNIKIAALFHDIGKPDKDTKDGHFYGHDSHGAKLTRKIMKRLKFSKAETKRVFNLVKNHMFFYPYETEDMEPEEREKIREKQWSDPAIRRFIGRVGEKKLEDLFALRVADANANPKTSFQPEEVEALQKRISEVREKDMALKIEDLDITGKEIMELGVNEGPEIGNILNKLLDMVIEDPLINDKDKLISKAKEIINESNQE